MFEIEPIICLKMDLALNNLQRLICHEPKQLTNPHSPLSHPPQPLTHPTQNSEVKKEVN